MRVYLDEVGRGSLYGSVFAAAVILPEGLEPPFKLKTYDSKKISPKKREIISEWIKENSLEWSIGFANSKEIEQYNIYQCTMMSFHRALDNLELPFDNIYVDGNQFKPYLKGDKLIPHECFVKGDAIYQGIGFASIIAKVAHTAYICAECLQYPDLNDKYDLLKNQGYGTKNHIDGILKYGFFKEHRLTYKIKTIPEELYTCARTNSHQN